MTGKELVIAAMKHEDLPAVPWVPFAGVHAGKLKGYTGREVLTEPRKLMEALLEVNRVYDPDGQTVVFDLQVEAEILGCKLLWAEKAPPSIASHPLADTPQIPSRLPEKGDGRLPFILDVMRQMKQAVGQRTALYGLVTGPLTLASHLRGTEFFMDMMQNPEFAQALLAFTRDVVIRVSQYYVAAGMDVIAVVDPVVSLVSPRLFRNLLSGPFSKIFSAIRSLGAFSSFFVCGDATKNIDEMCQTCPDSISIDENIDMISAKQITDRYNITIGGNIPLTSTMLLGTQQDNMKFVVDLFEKLAAAGISVRRNYILSPGCDMPYDIPPQNVIGILQAVRDPHSTHKILETYHTPVANLQVDLPDYAHLSQPLIEVFTIDSDTCAACGYMLRVAQRAVEELHGNADLAEYKITQPENIARIKKMGIQHLPAIFVNGELKFSSIIPSVQELLDEVSKAR